MRDITNALPNNTLLPIDSWRNKPDALATLLVALPTPPPPIAMMGK